ncbi:hypothetical protein GCM10009122_04950 [Fulvivirga kasyanovii]|uniref:Uncharacterized protein n=1 Tax=Fulvivirga kasyanovii TaxID=396812 RepID=A0ABW9RPG3_9BACT|nr:hypothetical protein [Fulvivirga kasyanovii]MTI25586.1 hypothetical protein [Fulvivirga kasyanovii]
MAFALGGVTFGGAILILSEQEAKKNYYLAKSNLSLLETADKYEKLMVIQDSILRIDSEIFEGDSLPVEKFHLIANRITLLRYYMQTSTQLDVMLVSYDLGMDKRLREHYYSKYKSLFSDYHWDKGGYEGLGVDIDPLGPEDF